MAARLGFCGLDRRREPLRGDEVRACWEDGAVPVPPDPAIPGLLDLLTIGAVGDDPLAAEAGAVAERERRRPTPRLRSIAPNRDWVEVEV